MSTPRRHLTGETLRGPALSLPALLLREITSLRVSAVAQSSRGALDGLAQKKTPRNSGAALRRSA
jgi:hypothetical protein